MVSEKTQGRFSAIRTRVSRVRPANASDDLGVDPRIERLELRRELARVRARWRLAAWLIAVMALGVLQWQVGPVFAVPLGIAAAALGVAWDRWQSASAEDERLEQDLRALTTVYHESPRTIRKWLTREFIDDSIRNLLAAAMDSEDLAHGYWKQGVMPFLRESERGYKTGWRYQIDIADLPEDVRLKVDGKRVATISAATHRTLHTSVTYEQRVREPPEMVYVAAVFDLGELPAWFRRAGFLLREVVNLPTDFVESLPARTDPLSALPAVYEEGPATAMLHAQGAMAQEVLKASVVIGDKELEPATLYLDRSGISWGFRLSHEHQEQLRGSCEVSVDLHTYMSRDQHHFPVVIAAPTRNPIVQFNYGLSPGIRDVKTEVFFSGERPWDARLRTEHGTYCRVDVLTERDDWVFAGSGCVFAWWEPQPRAVPQVPPSADVEH